MADKEGYLGIEGILNIGSVRDLTLEQIVKESKNPDAPRFLLTVLADEICRRLKGDLWQK